MPGIFHFKSASDLLGKLNRDYEALMADPTNCDLCFNFFVTAEHFPEWHFKGDAKKANELRRTHAALRICSQIANGAKHFEATNAKHTSVVATHEPDMIPPLDSHFSISLDSVEAADLGTNKISVKQLASQLLTFYEPLVNSYG